jgi:hypothetical protein
VRDDRGDGRGKIRGIDQTGRGRARGLQRERDSTLVRHIYDLHVIRQHYDAADVAMLAREIMQSDAETYGNQLPVYRADPAAETLRAVEGIAAAADFASDYASFRRDIPGHNTRVAPQRGHIRPPRYQRRHVAGS